MGQFNPTQFGTLCEGSEVALGTGEELCRTTGAVFEQLCASLPPAPGGFAGAN